MIDDTEPECHHVSLYIIQWYKIECLATGISLLICIVRSYKIRCQATGMSLNNVLCYRKENYERKVCSYVHTCLCMYVHHICIHKQTYLNAHFDAQMTRTGTYHRSRVHWKPRHGRQCWHRRLWWQPPVPPVSKTIGILTTVSRFSVYWYDFYIHYAINSFLDKTTCQFSTGGRTGRVGPGLLLPVEISFVASFWPWQMLFAFSVTCCVFVSTFVTRPTSFCVVASGRALDPRTCVFMP